MEFFNDEKVVSCFATHEVDESVVNDLSQEEPHSRVEKLSLNEVAPSNVVACMVAITFNDDDLFWGQNLTIDRCSWLAMHKKRK